MFEQKTTDGYVSVKLSQNSFDDSTYVARVPRDKVDLDNIVSDIAAGYPSLGPYVIIHAAELLKSQILKYLQQGKAVDVLELGTMYLSPRRHGREGQPAGVRPARHLAQVHAVECGEGGGQLP